MPPIFPQFEKRIEKGIPPPPRHEPRLAARKLFDRAAQRWGPRIVGQTRRRQHHRRRADFFHIDQVAAKPSQGCGTRARSPQQRRAHGLQVHGQHPRQRRDHRTEKDRDRGGKGGE